MNVSFSSSEQCHDNCRKSWSEMHLWHCPGRYQCTPTQRSRGALAAQCCCEPRASMGAVVLIAGNSTWLTSVLQLHTGLWISYCEFIWPLERGSRELQPQPGHDAWEQELTLCCLCVYSKRNSTSGFCSVFQGAEIHQNEFFPQKFIKTHLKLTWKHSACLIFIFQAGTPTNRGFCTEIMFMGGKMWFLSHVSIWLFVF